ncbi:LLM class flavin-dependent oxidoreductase [Saccharothrix sp. AJ9571]|nr:LLM class flavin-dependent oxidoreductase [Saccharothrix sp. AJ9571]
MRLGFALPHYDFGSPSASPLAQRAVQWAVRAEEVGFDQVWVSDHFFFEITELDGVDGHPGRTASPECWSLLAGIACRTQTVRIGSLVSPVGFRNPRLLARIVAGVDQLSGGRLDVGLGSGWHAAEFTEHGFEFPAFGRRCADLENALKSIRADLAAAAADTTGLRGLLPAVQSPVPLWVGGSGSRTLDLTARHADGWNQVWETGVAEFVQRQDALDAACVAQGRPPDQVRRSVGLYTLIGRDADDLAERWRRLQAWVPGGLLDDVSLRDWARRTLTGTPEQILARLREFADAGADQVTVAFAVPYGFGLPDDEQLELVAEHVLPSWRRR